MSIDPLSPASPPPGRPIAVTILGWVFAIFASFSVLTSGFAFVLWQVMERMPPKGEFPPKLEGLPAGLAPMGWLFSHLQALLIVQLLLAGFSIYAAIQFLKLRPWSRRFFEAVNWIALAWTVVFGVFFAIAWVGISAGQGAGPPAALKAFGVFAAIFAVAINGVFPAALIWLLRSKFVRPAFERPS